MTGFFKKLKETAEKGIEKSTELGTKGLDVAKESAKKGIDKAKEQKNYENTNSVQEQNELPSQSDSPASNTSISEPLVSSPQPSINKPQELSPSTQEGLEILKMRFVKGEISKEEFEEMKELLVGTESESPIPKSQTTNEFLGSGEKNRTLIKNIPLIKQRKYKDALKDFDKKLKKDPNDVESLIGKACVQQIFENHQDSISTLRKGLETNPNNAFAWSLIGKAYELLGNNNQAIESYDKSLSVDPNFTWNLMNKAWVLGNMLNQFNDALEICDYALQLEPDDFSNLNSKGYFLEKLNRKGEADSFFEQALKLSEKEIQEYPNDIEAWRIKSDSLLHLGRRKESEKAEKKYDKLTK